MQWDDGKLAQGMIRNISSPDGKCRVLYKGATKDFQIEKGQTKTLSAAAFAKWS